MGIEGFGNKPHAKRLTMEALLPDAERAHGEDLNRHRYTDAEMVEIEALLSLANIGSLTAGADEKSQTLELLNYLDGGDLLSIEHYLRLTQPNTEERKKLRNHIVGALVEAGERYGRSSLKEAA